MFTLSELNYHDVIKFTTLIEHVRIIFFFFFFGFPSFLIRITSILLNELRSTTKKGLPKNLDCKLCNSNVKCLYFIDPIRKILFLLSLIAMTLTTVFFLIVKCDVVIFRYNRLNIISNNWGEKKSSYINIWSNLII